MPSRTVFMARNDPRTSQLTPGPGEIVVGGENGPEKQPVSAVKPTLQQAGAALPNTANTLNVVGAAKSAVDFSGITWLFLPTYLDIRAFGARPSTDPQANRSVNAAALQQAVDLGSIGSGPGTRRVHIPGDFGTIYEYDSTITINTGTYLATDHEEPIAARLHYYGPVNTHAFATVQAGRDRLVLAGLRLEDKRGAAAATGTGEGVHTDQLYNGTHIQDCYITGFYRNLTINLNDMLRLRGGWLGPAYDYALVLKNIGNFSYVDGVAFILSSATAPTQSGLILVDGGGANAVLAIRDGKAEGDVATAHGLVINGTSPTVRVEGWTFSGGPGGVIQLADLVRIQGVNGVGIGQTIDLRSIAAKAGSVANLLHVVPSDGGDYAIPGVGGNANAIIQWNAGQRLLNSTVRANAYAWTQGAVGSIAPGTIVPGPRAGTTPTLTVDGDDQTGTITLTTGTDPGTTGEVFRQYFRVPWPNVVRSVVLTPANAAAATAQAWVGTTAAGQLTTTFWRCFAAVQLTASTQYAWHYRVNP